MERYGGPAALGMLRAGAVQLEHPCAAGSGVARAPPSPHRSPSPALTDAELGISGWMLLGMQVAPATVAMENTLAVKFPAVFVCPSLSLGESPCVRCARHGQLRTALAAPRPRGRSVPGLASPSGSRHGELSEDPKRGIGGAWWVYVGLGEQAVLCDAMPCCFNWLVTD